MEAIKSQQVVETFTRFANNSIQTHVKTVKMTTVVKNFVNGKNNSALQAYLSPFFNSDQCASTSATESAGGPQTSLKKEGTKSLLLGAAQRGSLLNNGSFPMLSPVASDHKRGILESAFSRWNSRHEMWIQICRKWLRNDKPKNEQIVHLDGGGGLGLDGRGVVECFHVSQQLQNSKVAGKVRKVMITVVLPIPADAALARGLSLDTKFWKSENQTQTYINMAAFVMSAKQARVATVLGKFLARLSFPPGAKAYHSLFRK